MIVVLLPDSGRGYLTKVFNDEWLAQYGFLPATGSEQTVGEVLRGKRGTAARPGAHPPGGDDRRGGRTSCRSTASRRCPSCAPSRRSWPPRWPGRCPSAHLLDALYTGHAGWPTRSRPTWTPPLPTIGAGEPVAEAVAGARGRRRAAGAGGRQAGRRRSPGRTCSPTSPAGPAPSPADGCASGSADPARQRGVRRGQVRVQDARSASTPSTRRGPGRANDALASTAHTGTSPGSTPAATSASASASDGRQPVAAGRARRRPPGPAARTSLPGRPHRLLAGRAEQRTSPPASSTISGTQCPGANGGSVHSSTSARGRRDPVAATRRATAASRARSARPAPRPPPRGRWPCRACRPSSSTSSSVCGSMVSTSAVQPRWASASSTTDTSTAHTAHRSWVTTRSASRPASAPASRW